MSDRPETVTISYEMACLINRVFLPKNVNRMRNAAPEVVAAVQGFKRIVAKAELAHVRQAIAEASS